MTVTPKPVFAENSIFAALTRSDQRGFFHWSIYLCTDEHSGYKFHAATCTDGEAAPFRYEYVTWKGPEDPVAVTFTKIGELDEGLDYRHLDEYLKGIPMVIPSIDHMSEPRFSCRVWFKEALRQLHDAEMFVRCPSVELLEDELRTRAIAAEYTNQLPQIRSTARADAWDY